MQGNSYGTTGENMTAIHLIEKNGTSQGLRLVELKARRWESGYWKVAEGTAKRLIGGSIFLHTSWSEPSHFGGHIDSFTIHHAFGTAVDGRIIFNFTAEENCKHVVAPPGASGEKRIVW